MHDVVAFSVLGLVQGLTEFLPVSSTGHLILAREVFGFDAGHGLAIDAVLQLATALAVVVYFFKDILKLNLKQVSVLAVGTVPAVIIGLVAEDSMETVFRSAELVAYALLLGSAVMLVAEVFARRALHRVRDSVATESLNPRPVGLRSPSAMPALALWKGFVVGLFQCLALIPGMSRSGMTISGGLFMGLTREAAARFGFLLSVPIILGSGLKKLLELGFDGTLVAVGPALLVGSVVAFLSGILAIHALLLFVRTQPLYLFIAYRVLLAGFILFALRL
jgi:undecaprenyl-diphosphatase